MNELETSPKPSWLEARPKLRSDLIFAPRAARSRQGYVVEDPVRGKFYRLGLAEYAFIAELNGSGTVGEALERSRNAVAEKPLEARSAAALLNWLSSAGLLEQSAAAGERAAPQRPAWWLNPIFIRIPVLAPDRLLERLEPYARWIGSPWLVFASMFLVLASATVVLPRTSQLVASLHNVFSPSGSFGLLVSWIFLKVVHEMAHGLVCRRYGAHAREAGIMLLLFLPIPYIDVTSSWRLRDRRHRIHIAAAGMLVELLIAAIAAFVWATTPPGTANQLAANVVLMASVTTVLFNANPLMRFDGYYILSDVLDAPNLYGQSQAWLRNKLRRHVLGLPAHEQELPRGLAAFVRVYAVAAMIWRIFVYVGLILAAALLWEGAGIVLAGFALTMWFAVPTIRWFRTNFLSDSDRPRPNTFRLAVVLGCVVAGTWLAGTLLPWPGVRAAPAVVDYSPLWVVRAPADAWVERLLVASWQPVVKGQPLAELRSDALEIETAKLEVEKQRAALALRRFEQERKLAAAQSEQKRLTTIEKQLAELHSRRANLLVRAPASGSVITSRVNELLGMYVRQGQELLQIGDENRKEVRLAATQDELDRLSHRVGRTVRVVLPGRASLTGRLERLKPRASTRPLHPALTAAAGGPLTVQRVPGDSRTGSEVEVRLLSPHFEAVIPLQPVDANTLRAGQTVKVFLDAERDSVGAHLLEMLTVWFRGRTTSGTAL